VTRTCTLQAILVRNELAKANLPAVFEDALVMTIAEAKGLEMVNSMVSHQCFISFIDNESAG
jgi:hypothetical protein